MLVTFRTEAYADILMFGDIAVQLLKLMGHSGTAPGTLVAEDGRRRGTVANRYRGPSGNGPEGGGRC
jgi:hypothetical protein